MEPLFVADKIIDQWFTGSGIWSPIRPDIGNFLDLDWITFSLQLDLEPDYPNEINCDHRKNLKWINSFMKKKYTISKWHWLKFIFLYSLGSMQYSLPPVLSLEGKNPYSRDQRWARIRTGSDWIRTEANFGRIRTGSDCNYLKICGPGLDRTEKICCFDVIILNQRWRTCGPQKNFVHPAKHFRRYFSLLFVSVDDQFFSFLTGFIVCLRSCVAHLLSGNWQSGPR